jgi:ferredoxin
VPALIAEACIGCGHCVTSCPENAIHMVLREQQLRIPKTNDQLWSSIRREAVASLVKEKILGSK